MQLNKKAKRPVITKRCQSIKKVLYAIFFKSEGPTWYSKSIQKLCDAERSKKTTKRKNQSLELATLAFFLTTPQHINPNCKIIFGKRKCSCFAPSCFFTKLDPCDFLLFPKVKKTLERKKFCFKKCFGLCHLSIHEDHPPPKKKKV